MPRLLDATPLVIAAVAGLLALGPLLGRPVAEGRAIVPDEALLTVPRADDPKEVERRELRARLTKDPRDAAAAVRLARLCIVEGRRTRDPRWLGQAQAALGPFWTDADPPLEALLLRATIRQSVHAFPEALADLQRARARATDAQILLTEASVLGVLGRFEEAKAACAALPSAGAPAVYEDGCLAPLEGQTGKAAAAEARLTARLQAPLPPSDVAWLRSLRGEVRLRRGDRRGAEEDLAAALAADPDDAYSRILLQDALLDDADPASLDRAIALGEGREADDAVLLRVAIATKRRKTKDAAAIAATLGERQEAARARGDVVHRREEARFALEVRGDAREALTLARANFQVQKEPADVRLLLEAGLAACDRAALEEGAAYVRGTGIEDPVLKTLSSQRCEGP